MSRPFTLATGCPATFQALAEGARYVDDRLNEVIEELRPDVVVEDNVVAFPALAASGSPWRTVSPTRLSHCPSVPSTSVSASLGMRTSVSLMRLA